MLAYINTGSLFELSLFLNDELLEKGVTTFCFVGKAVIFGNWEGALKCYEDGRTRLLLTGYSFSPSTCSEDGVLITPKEGGQVTFFSMKSRRVEFKLTNLRRIIDSVQNANQFFINPDNTQISAYSKSTGELLWTTDLTTPGRYHDPFDRTWKPGELRRILGLHRGRVYVAITNDTILELDARTGRTERRWREGPSAYEAGPVDGALIPKPDQSFLDRDRNLLVGLSGAKYWELDLHSGDVKVWNCAEDFRALQLRTLFNGQLTPHGDLLFFSSDFTTSDAGGRVVSILQSAAFDRRTKAVVWRQAFPHPGGGTYQVKTPVVAGRRVLVLDTRGTLHIFEKKDETWLG